MSKHFFDKYFFIGLLATMLAAPVAAQNTRRDRKKPKTELPTNDSIPKQTLTHSTPVPGVQPPPRPKRSNFLVGHIDDSYELGIGAFVNMTTNDLRAIFAPNVAVKPFVRFYDKYTIGVHANAIVQNYADANFSPIVNEMYLTTTTQTKIGKFDIRIGRIAAIKYPYDFIQSVPLENLLLHRFYFDSRRYLPRAVIVKYTSKETSVGIGYGEDTEGFGFTGNGCAIMTIEQNIGENFQIGGFLLHNYNQSFGDIYATYQPTNNDVILLELLDLGGQATFYGIYRHTLKNEDAAFLINGFVQSNDGMAGADMTFQHIKSGTYVSAGAHYHTPFNSKNGWVPFVQTGINKTIFPNKTR